MDKNFITEFGNRVEELCKLYSKTFVAVETNYYKKHEKIIDYFKSYKFWMAFYNKIFDENDLLVSGNDYTMLCKIALKLNPEHLINWTRNKLYEIDTNKINELILFLADKYFPDIKILLENKKITKDNQLWIKTTSSVKIHIFKIWIYIILQSNFFSNRNFSIFSSNIYIDDYILKYISGLEQFIKK